MSGGASRRWRFRPRLFPTAAALLLIALFCSLGVWQLQRAKEREAQRAAWLRSGEQAAVEIFADWDGDPAELSQRRVVVRGVYLPQRQLLIDNIVRDGRPGVEVLTPLRLTGSEREVLVDRGWVPMGPGREVHADWSAPTGSQRVSGRVWVPSGRRFEAGTSLRGGAQRPPLWLWADLQRYRELSGRELLPFVIRLDPELPGGYRRDWPPPRARSAMHIGYAIQWFAFALITALIWAWQSTREAEIDG
ncbi:MAG: SURF1 family protein [Gammaproteobacteria bacterium]|nr:MAG: SURF1 family protein [Gammaproteobacteria bacterium]